MRSHKSYAIFIVESGSSLSFMLKSKLDHVPNKCETTTFNRASQFIQNLHFSPDIIILDQTFLSSDALEILRLIKERSPKSSVILLHDVDDKSISERFRNEITFDSLTKENDSLKLTYNLIQRIMNAIETKQNKDSLFRQRVLWASLALIILLLIIIFIFY